MMDYNASRSNSKIYKKHVYMIARALSRCNETVYIEPIDRPLIKIFQLLANAYHRNDRVADLKFSVYAIMQIAKLKPSVSDIA